MSSLLACMRPPASFSSCSSSPSTRAATTHLTVSGRSFRCRRIGSATLCKSTPGGSSIRRHRMVEIYRVMTFLVSAPGWRRRFRLLKINTWLCDWYSRCPQLVHQHCTLVDLLKAFLLFSTNYRHTRTHGPSDLLMRPLTPGSP